MGTITLNKRVIICKPLMVDGYYVNIVHNVHRNRKVY